MIQHRVSQEQRRACTANPGPNFNPGISQHLSSLCFPRSLARRTLRYSSPHVSQTWKPIAFHLLFPYTYTTVRVVLYSTVTCYGSAVLLCRSSITAERQCSSQHSSIVHTSVQCSTAVHLQYRVQGCCCILAVRGRAILSAAAVQDNIMMLVQSVLVHQHNV